MRIVARLVPLALLASLSACATIFTGTTQRIAIDSNPEGAACDVTQAGVVVAHVPRTPDVVDVSRGSAEIQVSCTKQGYRTQRVAELSGAEGWVFGNFVIGGLLGVVIDFSSGAAYHYHPSLAMDLDRVTGPQTGYPATGYPTASAYAPQGDVDYSEAARFTAATGRVLPTTHGLIRVPSATPGGDPTYIWPTSQME